MNKTIEKKREKFMWDNSPGGKLLDSYHCKDFSEFFLNCFGDSICFRVYGNDEDSFQIFSR